MIERYNHLAERLNSEDRKDWLSFDEFQELRQLASKLFDIEPNKPVFLKELEPAG